MSNPEDPANFDPDLSAGGEHGFIGKAVVSYNIIFDEEPQLKNFYAFIRLLKKRYPTIRTIGGRVSAYLDEDFHAKTDVDSSGKV